MKTLSLTKQNDFNHKINLYPSQKTTFTSSEEVFLPEQHKYRGKGVRVAIVEEMTDKNHWIGGPILDIQAFGSPVKAADQDKSRSGFTTHFLKAAYPESDSTARDEAFSAKLLLAQICSGVYTPYEKQVEHALRWCIAAGAHIIVMADSHFVLSQDMALLVGKARKKGIILLAPFCNVETEAAKLCVIETVVAGCSMRQYRQSLTKAIFRAVHCVSQHFVCGGNYLQNPVKTFEGIRWGISSRHETQYNCLSYEHTSNCQSRRYSDQVVAREPVVDC